jgi:hypothetical protein
MMIGPRLAGPVDQRIGDPAEALGRVVVAMRRRVEAERVQITADRFAQQQSQALTTASPWLAGRVGERAGERDQARRGVRGVPRELRVEQHLDARILVGQLLCVSVTLAGDQVGASKRGAAAEALHVERAARALPLDGAVLNTQPRRLEQPGDQLLARDSPSRAPPRAHQSIGCWPSGSSSRSHATCSTWPPVPWPQQYFASARLARAYRSSTSFAANTSTSPSSPSRTRASSSPKRAS